MLDAMPAIESSTNVEREAHRPAEASVTLRAECVPINLVNAIHTVSCNTGCACPSFNRRGMRGLGDNRAQLWRSAH
eukprot:6193747-Pleurochrysis_carterae.AAC.1